MSQSTTPVAIAFKRGLVGLMIAVGIIAAAFVVSTAPRAAEQPVAIPAPTFDPASTATGSETAVLAGGCYWGMQAVFEHAKGVSRVVAGFSGGHTVNPTYEDVGTETTGHAESVQITYDPKQISYGKLLQIYFSISHNPTELNYQGPDQGTSYRSNIFYTTDAQKSVAEAYIVQLDKAHAFAKPIVTRIDAFKAFYPGPAYHQDYLIKNPTEPYIVINDLPKVAAFKQLLPELYRADPVTLTAN